MRFPFPQFRLAGYVLLVLGILWFGCFATGVQFGRQYPGFVAFGIAFVLLALGLGRTRLEKTHQLLLCSALLVAVYVTMRALGSPISYLARFDLFQVILYFGVYLIFSLQPSLRVSMGLLRGVFIVLVIGNCAVAAYQIFFDIDFHVLPGTIRDRRTDGASGFYNNHAHLAGILAIALGIFLPRVLRPGAHPGSRLASMLMILVGLAGIAASHGRGGIIAAGVGLLGGLLLWVLFSGARRLRKSHVCMAAIVVLGAVVAVGAFVSHERGKGNPKNTASLGGRSVYWKQAMHQAAVDPAFGTGSRTYPVYYEKHRPTNLYRTAALPFWAHNDYLQILAEYGWIGLVLVTVFVLLHVVLALIGIRRQKAESQGSSTEGLEIIGILAVLASALAHAFFDFNMRLPAYGVLVAAAFGLLASWAGSQSGVARERRSGNAGAWASFYSCFVLLILGAGAIFSGVKFGSVEAAYSRSETEIRRERDGSALSGLHLVVEADPQNYGAWLNLGMLRYKEAISEDLPVPMVLEYLEKASEACDRALDANPYDHFAFALAAECLLMRALGTPDETERVVFLQQSEQMIEQAIEWAPQQPRAFAVRGDIELNRALDYLDPRFANDGGADLRQQLSVHLTNAQNAYIDSFNRTAKVNKPGSRGSRGRRDVKDLAARHGIELSSK